MAWISQMKVVESRTVFSEQKGNGKAEREFTISFAPGELKAEDTPSIQKWCKEMSSYCKTSLDEALPYPSAPRTPEQGGKPSEPDKSNDPATQKQVNYIKDLINEKQNPPDVIAQIKEEYEIKELKELKFGQASAIISRLKERK